MVGWLRAGKEERGGWRGEDGAGSGGGGAGGWGEGGHLGLRWG